MNLFQDLNRIARSRARYQELCNDPEQKQKSIYFGVHSIFLSIATAVCLVIAIFLLSLMKDDNPILLIFGIIFGIAFAIGTLATLLSSLIDMRRQFKMNKRAVRWVALSFFILAIVVGIVSAIMLL